MGAELKHIALRPCFKATGFPSWEAGCDRGAGTALPTKVPGERTTSPLPHEGAMRGKWFVGQGVFSQPPRNWGQFLPEKDSSVVVVCQHGKDNQT